MENLSASAKDTISRKIDCFYHELLAKYEDEKYDENEYSRLCNIFKSYNTVTQRNIEDALAWKYGKTHENLLKNPKYESVIASLVEGWEDFVKENISSGDAVFGYWNERIGSSFVSLAFIAHLVDPTEIPIVDQHTFRAIRYFLGLVDYKHEIRKVPGSLNEIHKLRDFVSLFSASRNVSHREFDKYLMMFGKHVAPK